MGNGSSTTRNPRLDEFGGMQNSGTGGEQSLQESVQALCGYELRRCARVHA
eukprot:CAMPEP_0113915932 /NCGR_PEP_ID=MMETSP0780_2-20120614/31613_1 /TAXON_ID=652834 /ORGANISM="Palpitomonas bilix" /LENGTH=50 /DNA_ID=CAMNT_0000914769 /DNA_START=222 /DNA_END=374 /DNA_ORIENTATION=+ /assembly_acc=CAM_ASM_000599